MDLSANEALYRDTGYRATLAADRGAFLTPVVDQRDEVEPLEATVGAPVQLLPDGGWERGVPAMVDAILRRELADSGVVAGMRERAAPDALVVQCALRRFGAGVQEVVDGRRSLGFVEVELTVHAPAGPNGRRAVLLREPFAEEVHSGVAMRPPSPRVLAGAALRQCIARMLAAIDQGNVARAHVPLSVQ